MLEQRKAAAAERAAKGPQDEDYGAARCKFSLDFADSRRENLDSLHPRADTDDSFPREPSCRIGRPRYGRCQKTSRRFTSYA